MKALILAAGYGTNLYPITNHKPKALLTIKGRPIIEYILARLECLNDINEVLIITNHRYIKEFQKWFQDYPAAIPIRLIDDGSTNEKDKLGSMGDIAFAIRQAKIEDDLLVIGGDNIFSFSLNKFIEYARNLQSASFIGTFDLNGRYQPKKFGVIKLDTQSRVVDFQEKPAVRPESTLVAMCLYYFPKDKLSLINEYLNQKTGAEEAGHYISWLFKKDIVYGYTFNEGSWFDIGDIDSYTEAVFTF